MTHLLTYSTVTLTTRRKKRDEGSKKTAVFRGNRAFGFSPSLTRSFPSCNGTPRTPVSPIGLVCSVVIQQIYLVCDSSNLPRILSLWRQHVGEKRKSALQASGFQRGKNCRLFRCSQVLLSRSQDFSGEFHVIQGSNLRGRPTLRHRHPSQAHFHGFIGLLTWLTQ